MFNVNVSNSQSTIPIENIAFHIKENNVYFKDVNGLFNKFLGSWEYTSGPYYFKMTLTKKEQYQYAIGIRKSIQYTDYIDCHYIYKYNGITIYNFYPNNNLLTSNFSQSGINGYDYVIMNNNKLLLNYDEPSQTSCYRRKGGRLEIEHTYIGQTPKLIWTRTDYDKGLQVKGFECQDGSLPDTSDFQIPANMVLTKVN